MSYFEKANTKVTRHSYGSKVDKTFQREGVIPVKDRKEKDAVTESATNYKDLVKKVDDRRMNDVKEAKAFEKATQEGYAKVRDLLLKDFMAQVCVEALLVDENVVNANMKNILAMVEEHVDAIGGFEGVKNIAKNTNNPLLGNIIAACEATCNKVGQRNLREAKKATELNFGLNREEIMDFDYRKQSVGVETIANMVRDKVLNVVQDEQKMNANRQEIMQEIEMKANEMKAPVQEAMDFIFNQACIEESTLFNSFMRSGYSKLIESNSSYIFESLDEESEEAFEDNEFKMSDVELPVDIADDDDEFDDDEFDDTMFESNGFDELRNAYIAGEIENVDQALATLEANINQMVANSLSRSAAIENKRNIRRVENVLETMVKRNGDKNKPPMPASESSDEKSMSDPKTSGSDLGKKAVEGCKGKIQEEVILCPDCKKDPCVCKGNKVKESVEVCEEDFKLRFKKTAEIERLIGENKEKKEKLMNNPYFNPNDASDQIAVSGYDAEINRLQKELDRRNKKKGVRESVEACIERLEKICENMNDICEIHDIAYNNVMESMVYDIDGKSTTVPYIQAKDCNLSNLEFAYKVKVICESFKSEIKQARNEYEAMILERAIDLNLQSINETTEAIKDIEGLSYKKHILESGEKYLNKIKYNIENIDFPNNPVIESATVYQDVEDVDKVFNLVKETAILESTNETIMETVMAEAIVEYTILEAFNTLRLTNLSKEDVRKMARKNLNK